MTHDLGNPPFGHVGEYAIQSWFEQKCNKSTVVKEVLSDDNTKNDFLHFDGNAQGFRIITRLAGWRDVGGLQLTNATIGAMCKYPYGSKLSTGVKKKFGFHFDEAEYAKRIFEQLGMKSDRKGRYSRHPFAFLVEAADDICYLTTDIEDAFRAGHLSYNTASVILEEICKKGDFIGRLAQMSDREPQDKIAYLRSGAISSLVVAAIETFLNERRKILSGTYNGNIIETSLYADLIKRIRTICETEVYTERRKIETETAGISVIFSLLDLFGDMIIEYKERGLDNLNSKNQHLYYLLPNILQSNLRNASNYQALLSLVDYISGMTDRYALDLFAKLTGGSPTLGRML